MNKNRNVESVDINSLNKKINPYDIYLPKLICISSFLPYPMQFRTVLERLILYSRRDKIIIPIEKEIENLVLGIPFPKKCVFYRSLKKTYRQKQMRSKQSNQNHPT